MSDETHEALRVDESLEEEIQKALVHELTDEDIERAQLLLGVFAPSKAREHISVATPDAIRNWAYGTGDDNPLYIDEEYGPTTRWGSQIAPGTFVGHVKTPMLGDPIPDEIKQRTKGLFRGVHVFVSGGTWDWYRPLFPGDRLFSYSGAESQEVKDSEFAGRSVIRVGRSVMINQRGEVVGVYRVLTVNTERKKSRSKGKYADIEPAHYTDEDYERIDAIYAQEGPLGAEKRWFEDVSIGDELDQMAKGPLTVTDIHAFHMGGYGNVPYGLKSGRLAYQNRKRIKPFYIKNEQGVYDVAQRLHWDSEWAKGIGNPMAYDYGVMRQCYFYHHVSDWAGDDACIVRMEDSIRKFNYQGDTQFLTGKVVDKREENGRCVVDLELHMINQRDTESAYGSATVALPSRESGLPLYPDVPLELQREATAMFARHNERVAEKRRQG
jgi:acyl dehydratase